MTKLIPVVSNFKSEPIRPPVVAAETEKIETYIKETFGGEIYAAYGCSLGGSFVSLLVGRKHIHIDHAIIGSSDMDQAPKWLAYNKTCKELCHELNLPQTALDILMFLANNPEYKTARDIVEVRKIKANLVSVHVDRLVKEGYLERRAVEGDRRKTELICTQKAQPVIEKGGQLQEAFKEQLFSGMDEKMQRQMEEMVRRMEQNLDEILKGDN